MAANRVDGVGLRETRAPRAGSAGTDRAAPGTDRVEPRQRRAVPRQGPGVGEPLAAGAARDDRTRPAKSNTAFMNPPALTTRTSSQTSTSAELVKNKPSASRSVSAIGAPRSLGEVLSTAGTPVRRANRATTGVVPGLHGGVDEDGRVVPSAGWGSSREPHEDHERYRTSTNNNSHSATQRRTGSFPQTAKGPDAWPCPDHGEMGVTVRCPPGASHDRRLPR